MNNLDPVSYVATVAVVLVPIAIAALWPARRALRVDSLRALRYE